jgi:hypothetical protein
MAYYIRVFGTDDTPVDVRDLCASIEGFEAGFRLELTGGENFLNWNELCVLDNIGNALAVLSCDIVSNDSVAGKEIIEFMEEISSCEPRSAVKWINKYFDRVKVIYAFQMLSSAFDAENLSVINQLQWLLQKSAKGILQADGEGFSNEDGYHILWQFNESVSGDYAMAVISSFGQWKPFRMELDNLLHRKAFKAGKVPTGARPV